MKKWLKIALWGLFAVGLVFLMISVKTSLENLPLQDPKIHITVQGEHAFLTPDELLTRLKQENYIYIDQKVKELNAEGVEQFILAMNEVKLVKVYTHFGGKWNIDVELKKPICRVFNNFGQDFFLDADGNVMLKSVNHTARVPIVTGNIDDRASSISVHDIINNDSLKSIRKLDDVYRISNYVCNDPLMHALIAQIHHTKAGDFVLTPIVGGQKIIFGTAYSDKEVQEKFKKLKIFYKEAIPYEGWKSYSEISVKYDKQIVCKKIE